MSSNPIGGAQLELQLFVEDLTANNVPGVDGGFVVGFISTEPRLLDIFSVALLLDLKAR